MNDASANTAVLLFTRTLAEESKAKRFRIGGNDASPVVAQSLIRKSEHIVIDSGLPYFIIDSSQQVGHTFGQRLSHAVNSVFTYGFERVIIIGNDCPNLKTMDVSQVNLQLACKDLVLGPATDGGAYIIGLKKACYHEAQFSNLDWEKSTLIDSFHRYIDRFGLTSAFTVIKSDIDNTEDLMVFVFANRYHTLSVLYVSLLSVSNACRDKEIIFLPQNCCRTLPMRGPPRVAV